MRPSTKRKNPRLPSYDYSRPGYYFLTVCTWNKTPWFGRIENDAFRTSDAGRIVARIWGSISDRFRHVLLDTFVLMPNHIHCVVAISKEEAGAMNRAPTLGDIVRACKASSTRLIRRTVSKRFAWQRNYYEHVLRHERALEKIRRYIRLNPLAWDLDRLNSAAGSGLQDTVLAERCNLTEDDMRFCRKHLIF